MTFQAENSKPVIEIDVSQGILSSFHKAKDFLNKTADTLKHTTQPAQDSLTETAGKAANNLTAKTKEAVDITTTNNFLRTITATTQQAKASIGESIEQTLQTAGQMKSTASNTMQTAIASSINDWLQAHPTAARLVQVLIWATNHPIISLVILLFVVAIAWSLIKAISRLLEIAGLSLLQTPFKLIKFLIGISAITLSKFSSLAFKQLTFARNPESLVLPDANSQLIYQNKQQRLAEISQRLEAIRQEQNQLLQEASAIINSDTIDQLKVESIENNESIYKQHTNETTS